MHDVTDPSTGEVVFLRTPYNYDRNAASDASGLLCADPTRTQQHFRDEVDINTIVERFGLTGELPSDVRVPVNGDFTEAVTDYQTALNLVIQADDAFMQLPAAVRERFANDPGRLVEFVSDDANREEARKLGLLVPEKAPPEPMAVRVVPEPAPAAK